MQEYKAIFWKGDTNSYFLGHQFGEVYKEKVYAPYIKNGGICIDCGANIGVTTQYFSEHFDRVISVEPSKQHFDVLSKMVEFNNLKNVSLVNRAIYIESGEFPLFHADNQNKTMFSLHAAVGTKESELVKTITLGDLFKQEKIEHVDLLKMDIEGSETEVLSSTSFKDVADKIDLLIVERHSWSGRHPQQLTDALKNAGFTVEQIPSNTDLVVAKRI